MSNPLKIFFTMTVFFATCFSMNAQVKKPEKTSGNSRIAKQIKGYVYDQENKPLVNASILLEDSKNAVYTDTAGTFTLNAPRGSTLSVSYVGFLMQHIKVDEKINYIIQLQPGSDKQLSDVVVVGFGTQKKESVVGAISTINPNDLVVSNSQLSQGFAGRLSGVIALSPSGEPGNNASNFWIRGVATLGSTTPLIFLDGIEISIGDMNAIDPSNIETFSILKDASATALYAARGANGVLLITTKHGRISEVPKITALVENSFNSPTQIVKFADGVTYMNLYNEARFNNNPFEPAKYSQEKIDGTAKHLDPYIFPDIDWYHTLFKNISTTQHANVNIRGAVKVRVII